VARRERGSLVGEVIHVDRFGNLLTSVRAEEIESLGSPDKVVVEVAGRVIRGISPCYADRRAGEPGAVVGSSHRLEIFLRQADARTALGVERGAPVRLRSDEVTNRGQRVRRTGLARKPEVTRRRSHRSRLSSPR
jgi:S-adenosylmethionine hydrolase